MDNLQHGLDSNQRSPGCLEGSNRAQMTVSQNPLTSRRSPSANARCPKTRFANDAAHVVRTGPTYKDHMPGFSGLLSGVRLSGVLLEFWSAMLQMVRLLQYELPEAFKWVAVGMVLEAQSASASLATYATMNRILCNEPIIPHMFLKCPWALLVGETIPNLPMSRVDDGVSAREASCRTGKHRKSSKRRALRTAW